MAKYFKIPFAYQGDNIAIPDDLQTNSSVSYQQGWGYDYQRKLGTDPLSKPVPRQQTNQLYNDITGSIKQYQEQGFYNFISKEMNGGESFPYAMGACIRYDMSEAQDGSDIRNFSSLINENTGNPKDNPDDWMDIASSNYEFATNEEVQAGQASDKIVSPSTLSSLTSTELRRGLIQLATGDEVNNGSNATKAITPATFIEAFSGHLLAENGYQVLPGGVIIQWGGIDRSGSLTTVMFPIAFPNKCFTVQATISKINGSSVANIVVQDITATKFDIRSESAETQFKWFCIGN